MSNQYSQEVNKWLRSHTTVKWGDSLPTHCMSEQYQRLYHRSWPMTGVPSFKGESSVETGEPSPEKKQEVVSDEAQSPYERKGNARLAELVSQTRDHFRSYVEGEETDAPALLDEVERLRSEVQALASLIDEKFRVVRERTEEEVQYSRETVQKYPGLTPYVDTSREVETNTLSEAKRIKKHIGRKWGSITNLELKKVIDKEYEKEERYWRIDHKKSPSANEASSNPSDDKFETLVSLSEPKRRTCIDINSLGFKPGFRFFPENATVGQALFYLDCYVSDLNSSIDKKCNTHALLYFRLMMGRRVYREYIQYGEVKDWSAAEGSEWIYRDFSSSRLQSPQEFLVTVEFLLSDSESTNDAWRKNDGIFVPNAKGIFRLIKDMDMDLLRRKPDAYKGNLISLSTMRKYIDYLSDEKVQELRMEVGLA